MTAVDVDLQTALSAIMARGPTAAGVLDELPSSDTTLGRDEVWQRADLDGVLATGDGAAFLLWARRIGREARQRQVSPARFSAATWALAATVCRLGAVALDRAETEPLFLAVGAPIQAAALEGYLAQERLPSDESAPRPAGGDLAGRLEKMEALSRINRAANASLHLTATLDLVVEAVADVIHSDTCSVWIYYEDTNDLVLRAARGLRLEAIGKVRLSLGEAITGEAARTRKAISARDAPAHPAYRFITTLGEERYRSQVSVPILRHSVDRLVGVLTLKTIQPRDFTDDDIRFLGTVAGELAIAIENAQLYQQTDTRLREKVRQLATLQRVSARMAETLDLSEVLQIIVTNAAELGRARRATIIRINRETGELETAASYGDESAMSDDEAAIEREIMREVVARITPIKSSQLDGMVGLTSARRPTDDAGFSVFGMPLRSIRGVLGGICLHYAGDSGPTDEQYPLLVSFANSAAIAIENAQLYADAQRNLVVSTALLQEMHHRVRNNLQQTAGLLRMQMRRITEPSAVAALRQSVSRIQSIAAIHDLLSRNDLGVTTANEVAKRVVDEASTSLAPPGGQFRFHFAGTGPEVSARQATLLAVVITEMISNALRHGFRDRDAGDIWITSRVEGPNVVIAIEDSGRGLPPDFSPDREMGLGLNIARTLVRSDLEGSLSMTNRAEGGARVVLAFPFRPRTQRSSND